MLEIKIKYSSFTRFLGNWNLIMGNENSTPCLLSTEILFEILAFVKFHEASNIFLINRYLLQICQVYFHSGTVGQNKVRNVRELSMRLVGGALTIFVERNGGPWQSVPVPVPEVDPPKIFNAFGKIIVGMCCQIQAMQFLNKFQSLLTRKNNKIYINARDLFLNNAIADREQQTNSNTRSNIAVDKQKYFLNWIGQKKLLLELKFDYFSNGIARCLADEPLITQFNGSLCMAFESEKNLCGLEEDAKLIYGWISSAETSRDLQIRHYNAQKAKELACQIAFLFEEAHVNKVEAKKMNLSILFSENTIVPMHMQKICNGKGDQLATLRTFSAKHENEIYMAYIFYTKLLEHYTEKKEEPKLFSREGVFFL